MFSTLRGFLNRHKGKLMVTTAVIGGVGLAVNYAQRRLKEWQEHETKNFLDMARKKQHYESTERTCNQTIESLAPSVAERVMKSLDTDEILSLLRENPTDRAKLWEEMKVLAFARVSAIIYSYTILAVTLRIQLNLIGGYLYKDSVKDDMPPVIDSHVQQKLLSLCHYFVSDGVDKLAAIIKSKIKCVLEPISLKQKFTLKDAEQLFWSIQAALCVDNADPLKQMVSFLISGTDNEQDDRFKTLLNESIDLLESDEVTSLSISSVSRGFSLLFDQIAEFYSLTSSPKQIVPYDENENGSINNPDLFVNINSVELPLIKLIPKVSSLLAVNSDQEPSELSQALIQQLISNDKLKILGANIYEVFSN